MNEYGNRRTYLLYQERNDVEGGLVSVGSTKGVYYGNRKIAYVPLGLSYNTAALIHADPKCAKTGTENQS